jgi:alcohol dehydrogenase class IV
MQSKPPIVMRWPVRVIFGTGSLRHLGTEMKALQAKRALIITDRGVRAAGPVDIVVDALLPTGLTIEIFDAVHPDPPIEDVLAAAEVARNGRFDTVIGVGGGSALDITKAVSALAMPGRSLENLYVGPDRFLGPGLTKVLVPTTAGSGSEISDSCNFIDRAANQKRILISRYLLADLALVDPVLTHGLPPRITAETGIDAVTHAIEAFTTSKANVLSDLWAREALVLAARSLRLAYSKGGQVPQAREDMALSAMLGNAAADLAGLGAVHGLTHALTTKMELSHGRSNAILLPIVMEFNLPVRYERLAKIADIFDDSLGGNTRTYRAERAVDAVQGLCKDIGLGGRLGELGLAEADLPELANNALTHHLAHFAANPRHVSVEDAMTLYRRAL